MPVPSGVRFGHLDGRDVNGQATRVQLELVRVRLLDRARDEVGLVELPLGWVLEFGDLLVDGEGRLVQVTDVVLFPAASALAALVRIAPAPKRAR